MERGVLAFDEVPHDRDAAHALTDDRGERRTGDAVTEPHDEHEVHDDAHHGAQNAGAQRKHRLALGAQEVVRTHADALEHVADHEDLDEQLRHVIQLWSSAHNREDRVDKHDARKRDDARDDEQQQHRVADGAFDLVDLVLAQLDGRKRIAALASQSRKAHEQNHDGECKRRDSNARFADGLTEEDRVDDVVEGVERHHDDGGDRELEQKLQDALRAQAVGRERLALARLIGRLILLLTLLTDLLDLLFRLLFDLRLRLSFSLLFSLLFHAFFSHAQIPCSPYV